MTLSGKVKTDHHQPISSANVLVNKTNRWQSATASLGVRHQLNDRQELTLSLDYLYYRQRQPSNYANETSLNDADLLEKDFIQVDKKTPINFKVARVDYTNTVSDIFSLEVGVKGSLSEFANRVSTTRTTEDIVSIDPAFTDASTLDERILATYGSATWRLSALWNL